MRKNKVRKTLLVVGAATSAALLVGWSWEGRDKREDRKDAREERGTGEKRDGEGFGWKWTGPARQEDARKKEEDARKTEEKPQASETDAAPIKIQIGPFENYVVSNGTAIRFDKMDEYIKKLAAVSTDTPVLVCCTMDSRHGTLVRVLDICYKYKMYKIALLSM